jgi:FlaG/FlaF family flagellin (archaellin)
VKNKGLPITDSGFLIGTDPKPDRKVSCLSSDGQYFSLTTNDLKDDTTYYIQAYATNAAGTGYGEIFSFTTTNGDPVVVTCEFQSLTPMRVS